MNLRDIEAQAKALAPILRNYVNDAIESLKKELLVTIEELQPSIDDAAVKAVSVLPVPKDGEKGEKGDPGEPVSIDEVRKMVSEEVARLITEIELPKDGEDGRDALEIDILPRIDPQKSYERGSWATHNGGLWRAHATTDGMRGWECVVDGLRSVSVEQVDARNFISVQEMASGKVTRKEMFLPTMVYRQVFKNGENYQKGDVVSFGGSLWHCNEDTETKPGDGASCWTLCAKKGRDGSKS